MCFNAASPRGDGRHCLQHAFTGMAAGTMVCAEAPALAGSAIGGQDLLIVVFALAIMILGAIVVDAILHWDPAQSAEAS